MGGAETLNKVGGVLNDKVKRGGVTCWMGELTEQSKCATKWAGLPATSQVKYGSDNDDNFPKCAAKWAGFLKAR